MVYVFKLPVPVVVLTKNSEKNLKSNLKYPLFARLNLPHARTQIHTTQNDVSCKFGYISFC
jgi:hypothetical protein